MLVDATLAWDKNGNVTRRQDLLQSLTEEFWYDSLNRFDYSKLNNVEHQNITLSANGNITEKGGLAYSYTGAQTGCTYYSHTQPRAVRKVGTSTVYCYDANGNMSKRAGSTIGYTSYNLPSSINSGSNSSTLSYGAFRNRYKQIAVTAGVTETTIYIGGLLEKVTRGGVTEYRHLIHGGAGLASIYTRRSSGSPLNETFYVHTDHLGSPELITNASGGVVVRMSFAAYGERRDASDWSGSPSSGDQTTIGNTSRYGFTGHEHLDSFGLIHMNGRVYDPLAGRFLSRDPIIDGLFSSQGPNGYAYVWNNPLNRTDPSGFDGDVTTPKIYRTGAGCDYGCGPVFVSRPTGSVAHAAIAHRVVNKRPQAIDGNLSTVGGSSSARNFFGTPSADAARQRLIAAGAFLGGTAGAVAAAGCTAGSGGVCALGAPAMIAGGAAGGAVVGAAIAKAWDQLDNLIARATEAGPQAVQYALVAERAGLYPTVRGELVQLNAGDVWKYGISTEPAGRYPAQTLSVLGLRMDIQATGTLPQVYVAEKAQLIYYFISNGSLPPGNRIFK